MLPCPWGISAWSKDLKWALNSAQLWGVLKDTRICLPKLPLGVCRPSPRESWMSWRMNWWKWWIEGIPVLTVLVPVDTQVVIHGIEFGEKFWHHEVCACPLHQDFVICMRSMIHDPKYLGFKQTRSFPYMGTWHLRPMELALWSCI